MKNEYLWIAAFFCVTMFSALHAGDDLLINGDFTNPGGSSLPVPGWTIERGKAARVKVDKDDFGAELGANAKIVSQLCAVKGDNVKLEADVRGSGMGRVSFAAFDKDGKAVDFRQDGIRFSANVRESKVRARLPIPPQAHFIAVTLETAADVEIIFDDVEAEFERPWRKTVQSNGTVALVNERYYRFADLTALPFAVTLKPGRDIDFELENTRDGRWSINAADAALFRCKMEPDADGVWPFRRYKTEFELEAIRRGQTDIVFTHTNGTRFVVKLTVE
ncbi:MAG: hypothetical protein J6R86_05590 [Lentisphaeria bacterium]|nr:hypothetical protein [Lentisphaeria bacterium]